MADPIPLSEIPRPKTPEKYRKRDIEETFQILERDLGQKHDKRADLELGPGKSLVVSGASNNTRYAIGVGADGYLTLTDYATGVAGTFVVDIPSVDGLAQEFIDVRAEYASGDAAVSANVTINAAAVADIEGAAAYFEVVAAASGADPARFGLKNGKDGSLFVVDADQIWFGSQTVFDTSSETFITEVGSIRSRYGTAFGASSDVVRWDGPTSVNQGDETRTNGYMAIGTNGLIYHNSAALDWGATAAEAAASNALLPLGVNRVAYPRGEAGTRGWGEYNPSSLSSSIAQVKYAGRVGQKATVTATAFGQIYDLQAGSDSDYRIPVAPNERICVAVALEASNVNSGYVYVNWTDVSGAYISNATAFSWVGDLSFVTEKFGFLTAPANAAGCYIDFFVYAQAAGTLQLSAVDFRLCAVSSSQSVAPPFTPGRTFETGADVTVDNTASAITNQGLLALGNFYEQANDPGSVANGSFWAKTGTEELFIRSGDAWRLVSNLTGGALSMSLSSGSYVGGSGATVYNTATASGGAGGYTYAWTYVSGDALTVTLPSSATTGFSGSSNGDYSVYRCTVTDSAAASVYQDFTLAFIF